MKYPGLLLAALCAPGTAVDGVIAPSRGPHAIAAFGPERVVLAYQTPDGHLALARSEDGGESWSRRPVDPTDDVAAWVDVALVHPNTILIAYADEDSQALRFTRTLDGGERFDRFAVIDAEGLPGAHCSLAAPDSEHVLIAYRDESRGELRLARSSDLGDSWSTTVIDADGDVGAWCRLLAPDARRAFVVYQDLGARRLKVARSFDGGETWSRAIVDAAAGTGAYVDLAVAADGDLVAVYRDFAGARLRCARSDDEGSSWQIATVYEPARAPAWSAIGVLAGGDLLAAAYDPLGRELLIAHSGSNGRTWSPCAVPGGVDAGRRARVLPRGARTAWISCFDEQSQAVRLVTIDLGDRSGAEAEARSARSEHGGR